jgi:hypothetical protein
VARRVLILRTALQDKRGTRAHMCSRQPQKIGYRRKADEGIPWKGYFAGTKRREAGLSVDDTLADLNDLSHCCCSFCTPASVRWAIDLISTSPHYFNSFSATFVRSVPAMLDLSSMSSWPRSCTGSAAIQPSRCLGRNYRGEKAITQLQRDGPAKPQVSADLCWNLRNSAGRLE